MAISQVKAGAILNYISLGVYNLIGLFYTPYMLRMMGQSEYGLYSIVASVIAYLTLMDMGLSDAVIRYSVKYRTEGRESEQPQLFGTFVYIYMFIGTIVALIGLALSFNVQTLFGDSMTVEEVSKAKIMLFLMSANLALSFYFCIYGSIILAYEKFVVQKLLQILRIVLVTSAMIALLYYGYRAIALIVTQTVVNILIIIITVWYCKHKLKVHISLRGKLDFSRLKEILAFSFWVFFFIIVERIYWSSGQFILGITVGTVGVAVFSAAITLEHMYMGMANSISGVLLPKITNLSMKENSTQVLSDFFKSTGRIQYAILVYILVGFILFGRCFLDIWAGEGYESTYMIAVILFSIHTIPLMQSTGLSILKARNDMKACALIYAFCAIFCLLGEFVASKYFGVVGCAVAIALSMLLGQVIILNIYYARYQRIDMWVFWKEILKMSIIPALFLGLGMIITSIIEIDSLIRLIVGVIVFSCLYLPVFYRLALNRSEKEMIKSVFSRIGRKTTSVNK